MTVASLELEELLLREELRGVVFHHLLVITSLPAVFVSLLAAQLLVDPALYARLELLLRDQIRHLERRSVERVVLVVKQDSLHGGHVTDVVGGWQQHGVPHELAGEGANELFRRIVTQDLFHACLLLSVLRYLLDEHLEVSQVEAYYLRHPEPSECVAKVLRLEGALVLDDSLAEVGYLAQISVYRAQVLHELRGLEGHRLRVADLDALRPDQVLEDEVKRAGNTLCESLRLKDVLAPGGQLLHDPDALACQLEVGSADRHRLFVVVLVFLAGG